MTKPIKLCFRYLSWLTSRTRVLHTKPLRRFLWGGPGGTEGVVSGVRCHQVRWRIRWTSWWGRNTECHCRHHLPWQVASSWWTSAAVEVGWDTICGYKNLVKIYVRYNLLTGTSWAWLSSSQNYTKAFAYTASNCSSLIGSRRRKNWLFQNKRSRIVFLGCQAASLFFRRRFPKVGQMCNHP